MGYLTEICIQTSDGPDWSLEARPVKNAQEPSGPEPAQGHAAVSNQLRKSSLTPSQHIRTVITRLIPVVYGGWSVRIPTSPFAPNARDVSPQPLGSAEEALRQEEGEQDHDAPRPMRPPWLCALQPGDGIERDPHGAHQDDV